MALALRGNFKGFTRVAALLMLGVSLAACSTAPDWVDPTTWMGPDTPDQPADNGQYPDLASVPPAPAAPSSDEDRTQVAQSLTAARQDVQYSAEQLRGGTEAAAPPPSAPSSAGPALASNDSDETADETQTAAAEPAPPAPAAQEAAPAQPAAAPPPAPPPQQVASAEPLPPPAAPAPAPQPVEPKEAALPTVPKESPLGFAPSKAPPLDASVADFVPQPIISEYARTASIAPARAGGQVALKAPAGTRSTPLGTGTSDVGGPEGMSGAVVANLDGVGAPAAMASSYNPNGASGVVQFANGSTALNAAGRAAARSAAEAYKAQGGQGFVRVVGYASRDSNSTSVGSMQANFAISQKRAQAVARALIAAGVPADHVLIDAVGTSEAGAAGRRAEIYLQG